MGREYKEDGYGAHSEKCHIDMLIFVWIDDWYTSMRRTRTDRVQGNRHECVPVVSIVIGLMQFHDA